MSRGFVAAIPAGDYSQFDILSVSNRRICRLQVKSTSVLERMGRGTYRIRFPRGKKHNKRYSTRDMDFFIAVTPYGFYIIPVRAITRRVFFFFEPGKHPRYPLKWSRCALERYRDAWDLLR